MSLPFFYEHFNPNELASLSEANQHYISHVLRMNTGEELFLLNGNGWKRRYRIDAISKRSCELSLLEEEYHPEPSFPLHVAIAFTKNASRMEWFLEKACEIGIQEITPLITSRSEKLHFKRDRWEKILISAMIQSQQNYLPLLHEPTPISDVISSSQGHKFIAHCLPDQSKQSLYLPSSREEKTTILIGPEGDFTPEEIEAAITHQFHTLSLGATRLRTETAGLYVVNWFSILTHPSK